MLITRERDKLTDAIIFFVRKTKHCGITKLFKLLYFLDFTHFRETGRSVTGLDYIAWPKGPAPRALWLEIKDGPQDVLKASVRFENVASEESAKTFTKIVPQRAFGGRYLTKREKRIMEHLAEIYLEATADDMVEVTHLKGKPWDVTKKHKGMDAVIDYMLALDGSAGQLDKEEIELRMAERVDTRKIAR